MNKYCPGCREIKDVSLFYIYKESGSPRKFCKQCYRGQCKIRRDAKLDQYRHTEKTWRQQRATARFKKQHYDRTVKQSKRYQKECSDKAVFNGCEWSVDELLVVKEHSIPYRALAKQLGRTFFAVNRRAQMLKKGIGPQV